MVNSWSRHWSSLVGPVPWYASEAFTQDWPVLTCWLPLFADLSDSPVANPPNPHFSTVEKREGGEENRLFPITSTTHFPPFSLLFTLVWNTFPLSETAHPSPYPTSPHPTLTQTPTPSPVSHCFKAWIGREAVGGWLASRPRKGLKTSL